MDTFSIDYLSEFDRSGQAKLKELYKEAGISQDPAITDLYVLRQGQEILAAAGICGRSLRSLAVAREHEGQGLMALLVTELKNILLAQDSLEPIFIITKAEEAAKFGQLGFGLVAETEPGTGLRSTALLCHPVSAFTTYLETLRAESPDIEPAGDRPISGLVMNLNPLTKGHLALIDMALEESQLVHIFLLSADLSQFSLTSRRRILDRVARSRPGLIIHQTGPWLVSQATFPAYFYQSSEEMIRSQAALDAEVFDQIALSLGITQRYLGTEPFSQTTASYNQVLMERAKNYQIKLVERFKNADGQIISASRVRDLLAKRAGQSLQAEDIQELAKWLPPESLELIVESKKTAAGPG